MVGFSNMRPCAAALPLLALTLGAPAQADQYKQAADGSSIACSVSARELTRFALVGDQFASVSKISTGYPYNDFAVTNEPVRGDIYISVPETYAAAKISFFATTKKGYVYKIACPVERIEAQQIFITNPAIATNDASRWEGEMPLEETAARLVQAMAGGLAIDGYQLRQSAALPAKVGALEVQLIADYRGASLAGKVIHLTNRGSKALTIAEHDLAPRDALAVAILNSNLEPGASTTAYVVSPNGETSHD